ncbi:endocuticle structural glycoprotein ABD-5-like [Chironomus tepperi]|uniref:endocuticle structural glycoprotein ABD-5-like n=1 Tax=Chironomus tepperi TaxID=113505 RepID=UPI00391F2E75
MFKFLTAFTALVCISLALPQGTKSSKDSEATIVTNNFTDDGAGNFAFNFETSNGIKEDAKGNLKKITSENGTEGLGEVQQGSYSYVGDDGKTYVLKWVADENGFQPQGKIHF